MQSHSHFSYALGMSQHHSRITAAATAAVEEGVAEDEEAAGSRSINTLQHREAMRRRRRIIG
jgi:hypothetical protein